jgi:hypothetical protein
MSNEYKHKKNGHPMSKLKKLDMILASNNVTFLLLWKYTTKNIFMESYHVILGPF